MKRLSSLCNISNILLSICWLSAQECSLQAAPEQEIKRLATGWTIDVNSDGSKGAPSKDGSTTRNGKGTTLGVSEKVLTTSRSVDGFIRLSNTAEGQRSVIVRVRWIGKDAKVAGFALLKQEDITLDVAPGKEVTFSASSGDVKIKSVSLTGRHLGNDGGRISGWAVSVREKSSKTVLFAKGSVSELDRFATSDEGLYIAKSN